jgi:hypothetical protein
LLSRDAAVCASGDPSQLPDAVVIPSRSACSMAGSICSGRSAHGGIDDGARRAG